MTPIPSRLVLLPLLRSTLALWVSCHALVGVLLLLPPSGGGFWPGPQGSVFLTLAVPLLLLFDLKIQRLRVFLAKLGISLPAVLVLAFLLSALREVSASAILSHFAAGGGPR